MDGRTNIPSHRDAILHLITYSVPKDRQINRTNQTIFLGATKYLNEGLCPSVRPSVHYAFWFTLLKRHFWAHDAVYLALFFQFLKRQLSSMGHCQIQALNEASNVDASKAFEQALKQAWSKSWSQHWSKQFWRLQGIEVSIEASIEENIEASNPDASEALKQALKQALKRILMQALMNALMRAVLMPQRHWRKHWREHWCKQSWLLYGIEASSEASNIDAFQA